MSDSGRLFGLWSNYLNVLYEEEGKSFKRFTWYYKISECLIS